MTYNIAVVGATGNVGRAMLNILHERNFPTKNVYAVASAKSKGKKLSYGDDILEVEVLQEFDFSKVDIALFSPGSAVSREFAPKAARHCVVIDNTSEFRMDKDIPLIVPEVNGEQIDLFRKKGIISNPNCVALPIVVALKKLHDFAKIKRIVATSFQSVSGAGNAAMDELYLQTKGKYTNEDLPSYNFPKKIAFNVIPQIGAFQKDGYTGEEDKVIQEIKKILDNNIQVTATCVRVPVFLGHSVSLNVEFENEITAKKALTILKKTKGVEVVDDSKSGLYMTPIECPGEDAVFVSRVRDDASQKNTLNFWIVSDNLRKGAALNTIQIAEELIKKKYI